MRTGRDHQWLDLGIQRVLESVQSGRAFLQEHGQRFGNMPGHSNYFYALASERRRDLACGVKAAQTMGRKISSLLLCVRRATQRSVKFIRWLVLLSVKHLTYLYATL